MGCVCGFLIVNPTRRNIKLNTSESGATLGIADVPFTMGYRKIDRRSIRLVWKEFSEDCPETEELLRNCTTLKDLVLVDYHPDIWKAAVDSQHVGDNNSRILI